MAKKPDSRSEFERMIARHKTEIDQARLEIERVRREMDDRLAQMRVDMDVARDEIERAITRGHPPLEAARKYMKRWGSWPEILPRKRRPWRGFEGGDPVPVEPRPKPKPLIDGAEAPIE